MCHSNHVIHFKMKFFERGDETGSHGTVNFFSGGR